MDAFMGLLFAGIIIGMCTYYGLADIASAIRHRNINVNLPPIEVRHSNVKED